MTRKTNTWVWVGAAILALVLVGGAAFSAGAWWLKREARQAGVDANSVQEDPADNGANHGIAAVGADQKLPAGVPVYPGAKLQTTYEVDGNGANGSGAYEYEFSTPDRPAKVLDYYHRSLEKAGMTLALNNHTADGGMLVAEDDAGRRSLRVIVDREGDKTTINLTARVKQLN